MSVPSFQIAKCCGSRCGHRRRYWHPWFVISILFVVGAACGDTAGMPTEQFLAIDYDTGLQFVGVDGLVEKSAEILVVDAETTRVEDTGGVPFTVADSRIVEVIRSTSAMQTSGVIRLRQTGGEGVSGSNVPIPIKPGRRYLVFANPLVINTATIPDVYQVVGDSAAFPEIEQGGFDASVNRGGVQMKGLPATLTVGDVRESASRVPLRK